MDDKALDEHDQLNTFPLVLGPYTHGGQPPASPVCDSHMDLGRVKTNAKQTDFPKPLQSAGGARGGLSSYQRVVL